MKPFRYERASDASTAVAMLAQAPSGAFLGGGTNLVDLMKLGVAKPELLVDISHLPYDSIEQLPDVSWIDEDDPYINPMGAKGIGEIGIVGTAAAIANAVYHATGVRVRDLPITLDKLLS